MMTAPEQAAVAALLAGTLDAGAQRLSYCDSSGRRSHCHLRHFRQDDVSVLICTDLADNPGTSITNAAPLPWQMAEDQVELATTVVWLEHYGPESDGRRHHTFDRVTVDRLGMAQWRHLARFDLGRAA